LTTVVDHGILDLGSLGPQPAGHAPDTAGTHLLGGQARRKLRVVLHTAGATC
jgi:hypothetical protein